jgi:hypothetical protein
MSIGVKRLLLKETSSGSTADGRVVVRWGNNSGGLDESWFSFTFIRKVISYCRSLIYIVVAFSTIFAINPNLTENFTNFCSTAI